jgi:hypothetical protein
MRLNVSMPFAAALLLLTAVATPGTAHHYGAIACSDPRGCPDLLLDDLQMAVGAQTVEPWFEDDCAVVEGATEAGLRQLLRFTFTSPNLGLGDLIVGSPADRPDLFEYHACHDHFHFKEYADYRLWVPEKHAEWEAYRTANPDVTAEEALALNPSIAEGLITGEKRGFCVIDIAPAGPSLRHAPVVPDPEGKYYDCDGNQGISVGWADTYDPTLDGQWIDVTDVAPGAYILEAEVNAEHVYEEMDYSNNRGFIPAVVAPGLGNNGVLEPQTSLEVDTDVDVLGLEFGVEGSLHEGFTIDLAGLDAGLDMVFATLDEGLAALPTQPN